MKNVIVSMLAIAGFAGAASAQVQLDLRAQIDLFNLHSNTSPNFIGGSPSAVAWNGTDAYIAAYNNSGSTGTVGIGRVGSPLTGATFGTPFGVINAVNARGYSGLDIRGTTLAAAADLGGGNADSVASYNITTETRNWRIGDPAAGNDLTRRGNGVAFDPGFNGGGANQGVAYMSIGSGRRHELDATSGVYLNGQNAGAIVNFSPASTTWRDLDFNPANGDLYTRESNRLGRMVRTGDNAYAGAMTAIGGLATAAGVDNQNVAFVNSSAFGSFLIVNNRATAGLGQSFSNVIRLFDTAGNALTLSFPAGFSPSTGNGAYDFSWDAGSQTLAMTDFANRQLYIFAVPTPSAAALLGLAGLVTARRRR